MEEEIFDYKKHGLPFPKHNELSTNHSVRRKDGRKVKRADGIDQIIPPKVKEKARGFKFY